jgi:YfiH family protein
MESVGRVESMAVPGVVGADGGVPVLGWDPGSDWRFVFSTRVGGLSHGPFRSLNLGFTTGDSSEAVRANRQRLLAGFGVDPCQCSLAFPQHGTLMVRAEHRGVLEQGKDPPGDGIWTDDLSRALLTLTADCIPIAVVRDHPPAMAVVHAGWRSLIGDIGTEIATALSGGALRAALGPAIGPCCFTVSAELARRFRDVFGHAVASAADHVDLWACAAQQLTAAGCQVEKIYRYCTCCESELFFSQRRDGRRTGRQGVLGFASMPTDTGTAQR